MDTSSPGNYGASSIPDETRVFWWRDAARDVDVPRGHGVGWSTQDGAQHGLLTLTSEHLRLDADHVSTLLARELGPGTYQQLTDATDGTSPAVRLYAAGHVVVELDLADHFGPDCVVGVAVELRGHGFAARIAHQPDLAQAARDAALLWAESQVQDFLVLSRESTLDAHGWTRTAPSRWQITAAKPAPLPNPGSISEQIS